MARRRLDVREAAEVLGTSVDAVRKRIQRGTLEAEKVDDRVYVWLDTGEPPSQSAALISEMREHLEDLRTQLEAERQAHAEARRIIAGLVERLPPALEPPGASTEATEGEERGSPRGDVQEPTERPWWRFW